MYLQNVRQRLRPGLDRGPQGVVTYGDVYHQNEVEQSAYNFEHANVEALFHAFDMPARPRRRNWSSAGLPLPAYDQVCKASHSFNLLDARRAISVTERQRYILRVRSSPRRWPRPIHAQREKLGFPGLKKARQAAAA
jgi:glycyl-tRNA synthetase alpha chain